jgi:hypothetical protein
VNINKNNENINKNNENRNKNNENEPGELGLFRHGKKTMCCKRLA